MYALKNKKVNTKISNFYLGHLVALFSHHIIFILFQLKIWFKANKPKGLKVAKEDQKADRLDGCKTERGRERQRGALGILSY